MLIDLKRTVYTAQPFQKQRGANAFAVGASHKQPYEAQLQNKTPQFVLFTAIK